MDKIAKVYLYLLCLVVVATGCMFLGDRKVHVSGIVTDEQGLPLEGATVRFFGGTQRLTDKNGCFLFGGVYPGGRLPILVMKKGFKQYEGFNKFNYYNISVYLVGETSNKDSKAFWRILKEEELSNFHKCSNY